LGESFYGWRLVAYRSSKALLVLRRTDGTELDLSLDSSRNSAAGNAGLDAKEACALSVGPGGAIMVDGSLVPDEQLQAVLVRIHGQNPDLAITIKADAASDLHRLAFLMECCRNAGLNRFSLQSR
jgi:biopolymer transport protein ExbD